MKQFSFLSTFPLISMALVFAELASDRFSFGHLRLGISSLLSPLSFLSRGFYSDAHPACDTEGVTAGWMEGGGEVGPTGAEV